jgi:hypothetical protein
VAKAPSVEAVLLNPVFIRDSDGRRIFRREYSAQVHFDFLECLTGIKDPKELNVLESWIEDHPGRVVACCYIKRDYYPGGV